MKRRAFICLALVLAIAAMVFVACSPDFDDDTLLGEITKLESELKQTVQTPASYTLKKTIGSYDEKGNLRDIYIKWTIEDTYLITVTEGDGEVTVNIPETRSTDINYKLRATLVDEDGKAYTEDGKNFTVAVSRVAPKTDVGGGDDEGKLTADILRGALSALESELKKTEQTPASYTLDRTIAVKDDKNNDVIVYVKWTVEDTDLVTVTESNGTVTVNIPDTRSADINYKLRATLIDADGKEYTDGGNNFTVAVSRVAPKTDVGGGDDEGKLTADILRGALSALESELKKTEQTPASYTLDRTLAVKDDKNNDVIVYVKWTVEDTDLVTVTENNGTVTVNIPDTRSADINYKLRATLVDADGKEYTDGGNNFTVAVSRVAPKTDVGGGDEPTPSDKGTRDNPYTPTEAIGVGGMLSDDQFTDDAVYVKGFVVAGSTSNGSTPYKGAQGDWSFHLSDTEDGGPDFYVFFAMPTVDITVLQPGDQVTVYGFIEKFNGEIQMYGGGSSDKAKPTIVEYVEGDGDHGGGSVTPPTPGGDLTGEGTLDNPYTVADALTIIGSLAQGGYSDSAVYVQGTITGEITKGDSDELKFVITDNGSGNELTIWYAKSAECQTGDTVVVYGYLWNFYNNKSQSSTAEMADHNNVELAIVKVNGQDPSGGGDHGGGDTGNTVTIDFTAQGYTNAQVMDASQTINGLNIAFAKGSNSSTAATFYENKNGNHLRLYADNTMTISGATMTKIVFVFAKYDETNPITVNTGTFDTNTWTGSATSVSFHVGENDEGWHGHRRIVSITVTLASGQGGTTPGGDTPGGGSGSDTVEWQKYIGVYNLVGVDLETLEYTTDTVKIEITKNSIIITYNNGTPTTITDFEFSAGDVDSEDYIYDGFYFEWSGADCCFAVYVDDGYTDFGDLDGEQFYYVVSEDYGDDDPGTSSDDWSQYVGKTYTLANIEDESDTVTVQITANSIVITHNGNSTTVTEFDFYIDAIYMGDHYDDFEFEWNGVETFFSVYEDGYVELGARDDSFYYYAESGTGEDPTPGGGGEVTGNTVTIDFTAQGYSDQSVATDITEHGITVSFAAGTNQSNAPKWFDNGSSVRVYGGNTITISGATIVKVVIHFASKEYDNNAITTNVGNFSNDTWTGSTDTLIFTVGGNSGNRRIVSMDITVNGEIGGGSTTPGGGGTTPTPGGGTEPGGDQETPTGTITYDFVTAYGTYGPSWSNSYTNRTLTSSDLGIKSTVEFVFSNAGQGTTISDRPVLASKSGAEQYLTVNGGGAKITSVTFNLQEWVTEGGGAPKKFSKLRIEYTTDGSIWTEVSGVGFEDSNGKQITDYLTLSSGTLPSGVVSVRLVYAGAMSNSSDKSNKQFGLSSIILTLA